MTAAALPYARVVPRRLLTRREAAAYCGCGLDTFDRDWRPWLKWVPKSLKNSTHPSRNEQLWDTADLDALIESRKRKAPIEEDGR